MAPPRALARDRRFTWPLVARRVDVTRQLVLPTQRRMSGEFGPVACSRDRVGVSQTCASVRG
jgi:hypothetical protein